MLVQVVSHYSHVEPPAASAVADRMLIVITMLTKRVSASLAFHVAAAAHAASGLLSKLPFTVASLSTALSGIAS